MALENAALDVGNKLTSEDGLRTAMISLGGTCKACNSLYRY